MLAKLDQLVTGLRRVSEVAQKVHDAELRDNLADLVHQAADLKVEMAGIQEQNATLRAELQELRRKVDVRSKVELRDGLYFMDDPPPGYKTGPFCTRCLDADERLVTLMGPGFQTGLRGGPGVFRAPGGAIWTCPECTRKRT